MGNKQFRKKPNVDKNLRHLFLDYNNSDDIIAKEKYVFIHSFVNDVPGIDIKKLEESFDSFIIATKGYNLKNIIKYHTKIYDSMYTEATLEMDLMREVYYDFILEIYKLCHIKFDMLMASLYILTFNIEYKIIKKDKIGFDSVWSHIKAEIKKDLTR